MSMNIREALSGNRYPGRGIVLGMSGDGRSARVAYFIMQPPALMVRPSPFFSVTILFASIII